MPFAKMPQNAAKGRRRKKPKFGRFEAVVLRWIGFKGLARFCILSAGGLVQKLEMQNLCDVGGPSRKVCIFIFLPSHDAESDISVVWLGNK